MSSDDDDVSELHQWNANANLHKKCTQASEELHSQLHSAKKKRKTEEDDDELDEKVQPLLPVELKYRALLVKDMMLLRSGASVQLPWSSHSRSALVQLATRR
jgi:hypothetical protein